MDPQFRGDDEPLKDRFAHPLFQHQYQLEAPRSRRASFRGILAHAPHDTAIDE